MKGRALFRLWRNSEGDEAGWKFRLSVEELEWSNLWPSKRQILWPLSSKESGKSSFKYPSFQNFGGHPEITINCLLSNQQFGILKK